MSIPTKAINKYIDCNHKMIFHAIFHRNRNTPNIRLLILNKTSNSQKDSEKEEHSWTHLPLWLQTISRSGRKHHSEDLTRTQTRGLKEGIESREWTHMYRGQFMNIKLGTNERRAKDSLLKKQWQENWPPVLRNITGHPPDHLTEI